VQAEQRRVGLAQQRHQFLVRGLLAGMDPLQVHDQLQRDAFAGLANPSRGRTDASSLRA
jgi:hypothetical protein